MDLKAETSKIILDIHRNQHKTNIFQKLRKSFKHLNIASLDHEAATVARIAQ